MLSLGRQASKFDVLVVDASGTEQLRLSTDHYPVVSPAPDGKAVVLGNRNFILHTPDAQHTLLSGAPNPRVAAWDPTNKTVLVGSHYGFATTYYLVDRDTGEEVWSFVASVEQHPHSHRVAFLSPYILVYSQRFNDDRTPDTASHEIVALDQHTGRPVATWKSSECTPVPNPARLMSVNGDVYFVSEREFALIDRQAIRDGGAGWKKAPTKD